MTDRLDYGMVQDRTMPTVVYALYLLGFVSAGLTTLVGVFLAYGGRASSDLATAATTPSRSAPSGSGWAGCSCPA